MAFRITARYTGREGEGTHGRDCPAIIRGAAGSRGALASAVVATFIALFIALLNFFFPRRKEQGEEEEEEEAPDRFLK